MILLVILLVLEVVEVIMVVGNDFNKKIDRNVILVKIKINLLINKCCYLFLKKKKFARVNAYFKLCITRGFTRASFR